MNRKLLLGSSVLILFFTIVFLSLFMFSNTPVAIADDLEGFRTIQGEQVLTDKVSYVLGEVVTIHYVGNIPEQTHLILRVGNDLYKYEEGMLNEMRFRPTRTGTHELTLMHIDGSILNRISFNVGTNPTKPIISIPQNKYVNEALKIDVDLEGIYVITIQDSQNVYSYEGEGSQSLYYTPRIEGDHSISIDSIREEGLVPQERMDFDVIQRYQPYIEPPSTNQNGYGRGNSIVMMPQISYRDDTEQILKISNKRNSPMRLDVRKSLSQRRTENVGALGVQNNENLQDLIIQVSNSRIKSVILEKIDSSSQNELILEEMPIQYFASMNGTYAYLLDPSGVQFESGMLQAVATGTGLMKCTDYDEVLQKCNNNWEYLMDLTPGEEYIVHFDMVDPVFVETGASVINTNISDYIIGESAKIIVAAADEDGYPARNSEVYLNITLPNGTVWSASTSKGTIQDVAVGVYELETPFLPISGVYKLDTFIVGFRIESYYESYFVVHESLPVRLIRKAPTLHDPTWKNVSIILRMDETLLNQFILETNFNVSLGEIYSITDSVPKSFELIDIGDGSVVSDNSNYYITWLRMYNTTNQPINYTVQTPSISPKRYSIGPSMLSLGDLVFIESRSWNILVDPALNVSITPSTVESCLSNGAASTCTVAQVESSNDVYANGGLSYRANPPGIAQIVTQHFDSNALPLGANLTGVWLNLEWRTSTAAATTCQVEVWNNETSVWSTVSTTCPGTTDNNVLYDLYALGINNEQRAENTRIRVTATATANPAKTLFVDLVNVTLTYIPDPEPLWSNPNVNATSIFQGNSVKFNATWTDNLNLSGYIFSTNNTGSWINNSFTTFTGTLNYSIETYSVTATANTRVGWAFYANDSYGYWNKTDIQTFVVADANDNITPNVTNENVNPTSGVSGTFFNLSATITDNTAVQEGKAEISYPNGTKINHTMSNSGSTYYYLYESHMGGRYNATIYGIDANNNINRSNVVLQFNVTSNATTDKMFYQRSDSVIIDGRGFSPSTTQTIRLYHENGTQVSALYGFPVTRTTNAQGFIDTSITIPSALDFSSGNYTIGINDGTEEFLDFNVSIRVIHKPNTALVYDSTRIGQNVLTELYNSDGSNVTIVSNADENYIELTFTNKIPASGYVVEGAYFGIQHFQPSANTVYITYYNATTLTWSTACTITGSTTSRFDSCNLSSIINTDTLANSISLRVTDLDLVGTATFENIDFVYMHIPTIPSNDTIVNIITPTYIGKIYDYTDTTFNRAYGGAYGGAVPPTTQLNGTEASSTNYEDTTLSDNERWQTTITTGNSPSSRVYQSYYFTITEGFEDISSMSLYHEGFATDRTDFQADDFTIYAYNYTGGTYVLLTTVTGSTSDIITTYSFNSDIDDFVRSDGQINVLFTGTHTTAGGPNARADFYTDQIHLTIDSIPVISGSSLINASAIDFGEGINYCEYRFLNTSGIQIGPLNLTYGASIYYNSFADTTQIANGLYDINVTCYDNDVGFGSDIVTVRVINSIVYVNLSAPANDSLFATNEINFTYNASSQASGVLYCNLTINGIVEESNILTGNPGSRTIEKTGISDGTKYWNVSCIDNAGQTNTSTTWIFTVNTQPPNVTLINPPNSTWLNYTDINFTYIPYEAGDVDFCNLYINGVFNQSDISISSNIMNNFSLLGFNEGYYSWIVGCQDSFGLSSNSSLFNFTVDITSPSVTINGPANGSVFDNVPVVQLNYTVTDNLDSEMACEIIINGFLEDTNLALNNTLQSRDLALADGNKTWYVRCEDDAGNIGLSESRYFRVIGSPTVILLTPLNLTYLQGSSINFVYYAEDGDGIQSCSLLIDGITNQTNISINNYGNNTFTLTGVTEGQRLWNVACTDTGAASGTAINNRTFIVDNTVPNISISAPLNGSEIDSGFVQFNFTVVDGWSPNTTCSINVDGSLSPGNSGFSVINNTLTVRNQSGLTDGNHNYIINCQDLAGNNATTGLINFSVDGPPTIILYTPLNNSVNNGSNINFTYFLTDQGGVNSCSLIINGLVNATTASLNNPGNNSFLVPNIQEGQINWTVRCEDTALNLGEGDPFTFISDKTSPSVTAIFPDGDVIPTNEVTFNFTATDNYAAILECTISVDSGAYLGYANATNNTVSQGIIENVPNGFHIYVINCSDEANNIGFSSELNFTVDSRPVVIMDNPSIDYVDIDGDINFTYRVFDSTLTYCELYINGEFNQTNSTPVLQGGLQNNFSLLNLPQGAYDWAVYCYNENLFNGTDPFAPFDFYVDFDPPTATLNFPSNLSVIQSGTINFNWTSLDAIVPTMYCDLLVNDTVEDFGILSSNGTQTTYLVSGFLPDTYTWTVNCTDGAYYYSPEVNYFEIDGTPSVTLVAPPDLSTVGTADIEFAYIPGSVYGFQFCELYFNNLSEQTDVLIEEGIENNFNITGVSEGWQDWFVNCFDTISQEANSSIWSFLVDLTDPVTTAISPDDVLFNISTIPFNWTSYDNYASTLTCNIIVNGTIEQTNISLANNTYQNTSISGFDDGFHEWYAICYDGGLRNGTSSTLNFTVQEPPSILLNSPINGSRNNTLNWTVFYTPSDNSLSVDNCSLYVNGLFDQDSDNITNEVQNNFSLLSLTNGQYNWTVGCFDPSGNFGINDTNFTFYVDLQGPLISINYPLNGSTLNENDVNFNWTAIDHPSTMVTCDLYLDGVLNASGINGLSGAAVNYTILALADGPHNWSLYCVDDLGNGNNTETYYFSINQPDLYLDDTRIFLNNTNPDWGTEILVFANVSNIGGNPAVNANISFWDGGPLGIFLGSRIINLSVGESQLVNVTFNVTGFHQFFVEADPNNLIGELNETNNNGTYNFSVLRSIINSPPNGTWTNISPENINFTIYDYINSTLNYSVFRNTANVASGTSFDGQWQTESIPLIEGINTVIVQAFDSLLRQKNSTPILLYYDITAPNTTFQTLNGTFFNISSPNISFTLTDNLAPTINYSIFINSLVENSDTVSNNTQVNHTTSVLSEGLHEAIVESLDLAGNYGNNSLFFFVDFTPPSISLLSPENNSNYTETNVNISFSVSDNLDAAPMCNIYFNGVPTAENVSTLNNSVTNYTFTNITEGTHSWQVECWDGYGTQKNNVIFSEERTINIYIPPVITLLSPLNNTYTSNINQVFIYNVSDDTGILSCSLYINGVLNQTDSAILNNNQNNFSLNGLTDGYYNWLISCLDNTTVQSQGNSTEWFFTIDTVPPFAQIITPAGTWFNTLTPQIEISISDSLDPILNYTIFSNLSPNTNGLVNNGTNTNITLSALTNDMHSIILQGTDDANNADNTSAITIYVDTLAPNINLQSPASGSEIFNTTITFNFTAIDNMAPTLSCSIDISNHGQIPINVTNGIQYSHTESGLAAGLHYWNVTCFDLAGNSNISETWNFTIPLPDMAITTDDIYFNVTNPSEGENITIFANISNLGITSTGNFSVRFHAGLPNITNQIGTDQTLSLGPLSNGTVNVTWLGVIGSTDIWVLLDPDNNIIEENESNNNASKTLVIESWQYVYGNVTGSLQIDDETSETVFVWIPENITGSHLYVVDLDSNVEWTNLQALSRNTSGGYRFQDFTILDSALGSENYSDSVNNTYTNLGNPRDERTFSIFGSQINNVPILNTTNSSDFITGILWDTTSSSGFFNGSQDVVFITEINQNSTGGMGIYDFEFRVPANLRYLKGPDNYAVAIYAELV